MLSNGTNISTKTCIIITRCRDEQREVAVGLLIDEVNDFIDVDPAMIAKPPRFGHAINSDLIQGLVNLNKRDYLVLNVEKLLDLQALIELLETVEQDASNGLVDGA